MPRNRTPLHIHLGTNILPCCCFTPLFWLGPVVKRPSFRLDIWFGWMIYRTMSARPEGRCSGSQGWMLRRKQAPEAAQDGRVVFDGLPHQAGAVVGVGQFGFGAEHRPALLREEHGPPDHLAVVLAAPAAGFVPVRRPQRQAAISQH